MRAHRCRQLRNKVLHSDFYAMREKLKELGVAIAKGQKTTLSQTGIGQSSMDDDTTVG
jgi:hypothetical protein